MMFIFLSATSFAMLFASGIHPEQDIPLPNGQHYVKLSAWTYAKVRGL
jgi:hypothetical protein